MTDLVERLNAGLKLLDSKLHTLTNAADVATALGLRDMLTETRNEIVSLRSRLSDIESQNRVMWDVANDREARLAEEVKNKNEFERDWLAACDELCNTRSRLAEAKRDAARYQFIRNCCEVTCLGVVIESDSHIDQFLDAWPDAPKGDKAMKEGGE